MSRHYLKKEAGSALESDGGVYSSLDTTGREIVQSKLGGTIGAER